MPTHWIAEREGPMIKTGCGLKGRHDVGDEFETRALSITAEENVSHVDCKSCLKSIERRKKLK
jgi:hypothetical protein